ncbi:MAG: response regulator [Butyrivibrio sp.]|nr:response regulator [Butyrivibrio sp.]
MIKAYIADDEVWVVLGLKKQLERTGYPVEVVGTANNGLTAREEIIKLQPDVVFTDIRMPGVNGLELLKEIGSLSSGSRVVIVSGYSDFEYARNAVSNHAYDYLVKPVRQENLDEIIGKINAELNPEETDAIRDSEIKKIWEANAGLVDRIIAEIREHYTEDISLSEYALKYDMSLASLSSQLKEKLSMNYSDYLTSLRLQRAKTLLKEPNLSIQEIAEQSGYTDYFYFTKVFKKAEGISPSKYRKEI